MTFRWEGKALAINAAAAHWIQAIVNPVDGKLTTTTTTGMRPCTNKRTNHSEITYCLGRPFWSQSPRKGEPRRPYWNETIIHHILSPRHAFPWECEHIPNALIIMIIILLMLPGSDRKWALLLAARGNAQRSSFIEGWRSAACCQRWVCAVRLSNGRWWKRTQLRSLHHRLINGMARISGQFVHCLVEELIDDGVFAVETAFGVE